MNNQEWLGKLAGLTGLPLYTQHNIFGDKSGALVGTRDGYVVALGAGKAEGGNSAILLWVRYAETPDPKSLQEKLKAAKGKFDAPKVDQTTAVFAYTYSFGKPAPEKIAEDVDNIIAALKTSAMPLAGKCEKCQKSGTGLALMNNLPVYYCSTCQGQLSHDLNNAAAEYDKLETNLPLGIIYGIVAALIGSFLWGGVAYLLNRIFLWGAIIIGLLIGKAVVMGMGKINWTGRILIGLLTAASVAFGDVLFYTFVAVKTESMTFMNAMTVVIQNFWAIEKESEGGILSIVFGLIGAGVVMYSVRKPEFKAQFVPLGTPTAGLASATAAK